MTVQSEQLANAFLHDGSLTSNVNKEAEIEEPGLLFLHILVTPVGAWYQVESLYLLLQSFPEFLSQVFVFRNFLMQWFKMP